MANVFRNFVDIIALFLIESSTGPATCQIDLRDGPFFALNPSGATVIGSGLFNPRAITSVDGGGFATSISGTVVTVEIPSNFGGSIGTTLPIQIRIFF
jgi:hypothetical protein